MQHRMALEIRPFEVGYLGNIAYSMEKQLPALGLPQQKRRTIRQEPEEPLAHDGGRGAPSAGYLCTSEDCQM